MGEIAEAMLDGTLCEGCGEYIGSDAGYPQYCSPECAADRGIESDDDDMGPRHDQRRKKVPCGLCNKRFKTSEAVDQHRRDKHGEPRADISL